MKKYFIYAFLVLLVGMGLLVTVIYYLPILTGTQSNQHKFIDQLENEGWVDFNTDTHHAETLDQKSFRFEKSQLINHQDATGEVVYILSFWASWCSPCVEEFPSMIELVQKFPKRIKLIAISEDFSMEDIQVFLKSFPNFKADEITVIYDKEQSIMKQYHVSKLPEAFIFNSQGKLVRKVSGSIRWSAPDALEFFSALLHAKSK